MVHSATDRNTRLGTGGSGGTVRAGGLQLQTAAGAAKYGANGGYV